MQTVVHHLSLATGFGIFNQKSVLVEELFKMSRAERHFSKLLWNSHALLEDNGWSSNCIAFSLQEKICKFTESFRA